MALTVLVGFGAMSAVHAQTASVMPTLYNQSGSAVNTGLGYLNAGNYYLSGGILVQYYGNGTFYDPSIQQYGGSTSMTGMALQERSARLQRGLERQQQVALMPWL